MHNRSILIYSLFALQFCGTLSSTIPHAEPFRLPLHEDEADDNHSSTYISRKSSTRAWTTKLRNRFVERVFGNPTGEKHHGQSSHLHYGSSSQVVLREGGESPSTLPFSRYQNEVVLRFNVTTDAEARALAEAAEILFLDVWSATKTHADIRLDRDVVQSLLGLLPVSLRSSHARLMHDLSATVRETFPGANDNNHHPSSNPSSSTQSSGSYRITTKSEHFFSNYQPLSVINPWMKLLQSLFPTHVSTFTIGKSYEGRDIHGIRVGRAAKSANEKRKAIIITGASHAREWISVSTVCYLAHAFITQYRPSVAAAKDEEEIKSGDKEITRLIDNFDWYFIPTLNVDGYVYTWEQDRLWRKNRQPTSLGFCKGVELDRSYGFKWGGQSQNNPCSENYPGEHEFEASEAKSFATWAKNLTAEGNTQISGFLDLHSYSQQILYPYSYSCETKPADLENLEELAEVLAKAIRIRHGEHYEVSSACQGGGRFTPADTLSSAESSSSSSQQKLKSKKSSKPSHHHDDPVQLTETGGGGSALDYFYQEIGVPYSYQIKLRDQGSYGFLLPRESIKPTGEEIESMVKSFGNFLIGDK